MRKSRIKAKLARREPVHVVTLHLTDPSVFELASLLGFDGIWLDMEHHGYSLETAANLMRAARVGVSDVCVRPAKGEFMRMGRMLEAGAQGIIYPRCTSADEAAEVVRWAKFAPLGTRGIDAAGADCPYGMMPLTDYIREANEQTFIVIQVEDAQGVAAAAEILAVDGVNVVILGPGDFSILSGIAGQWDHPLVRDAQRTLAAAARATGKHWGYPCGTVELAKQVIADGATFISYGADILMVKKGLESALADFRTVLGT